MHTQPKSNAILCPPKIRLYSMDSLMVIASRCAKYTHTHTHSYRPNGGNNELRMNDISPTTTTTVNFTFTLILFIESNLSEHKHTRTHLSFSLPNCLYKLATINKSSNNNIDCIRFVIECVYNTHKPNRHRASFSDSIRVFSTIP